VGFLSKDLMCFSSLLAALMTCVEAIFTTRLEILQSSSICGVVVELRVRVVEAHIGLGTRKLYGWLVRDGIVYFYSWKVHL
jgi:hypothetical protein